MIPTFVLCSGIEYETWPGVLVISTWEGGFLLALIEDEEI
jgi:hypothetical protein